MENQLSRYGLSLDDAMRLGWRETIIGEQGLPAVRAIQIPYYEPLEDSFIASTLGTPFVRYRVLTQNSLMRYCQPPGTGVEAYYPRNIDWRRVNDDVTTNIVITEGEAKAARACKDGFPTIGLGGVWSFRSLKNGVQIAESLKRINMRGRYVYIVYDSDIISNINVVNAINQLAQTLTEHCGALPYVAFLPPAAQGKVGLDDFLNMNGAGQLVTLLESATPVGAAEALFELNNKYAVVKDSACVWSAENKKLVSRNNFVSVIESTKKTVRYKVAAGGVIKPEVVSAADEWLKWPLRTEYQKMVYEPGEPVVVGNDLNIWPGWGCAPKEGDVAAFLRLLNYFFEGNQHDRDWFIQWLAYPLQHPGVKLYTAAVLYSTAHGTGKSFLGQVIGKIYGRNFAEVKGSDLTSNFNYWAENKQFILGDEIVSSDKRQEADTLKRLITASELRVNKKYVEEYVIRDCINYLFTTNHPDAFFLEDRDRRLFIHEIRGDPLPDAFYAELHEEVHFGALVPAVFHYLLNTDLSTFNPRAKARETIGKALMFEAGLGDLAQWVRYLIANPDVTLKKFPGKDVFSAQELLLIYDPLAQKRVTANGIVRELARAGCRPLCRGDRVQTHLGNERLYAVRNTYKWEAADKDSIVENYKISVQQGRF